ncbi:hypothetical protein DFJ58DRAFT_737601 [Suillus subalutaceus]|uniref:uncharacterized protein n=1 Tax=Suillus subalutaceus TaxID=48586 RepID=UPI001B86009D|nr:uncharacterized protein DFJ58DRAFT_737601 [Suillus subalutaceus]KAG1828770.1 hypothetical protein DFJ58DRAFT_737601 [Suillus subalutaceus]
MLLKGAKFLWGLPNDNDDEANFAHNALYRIVDTFYYGRSRKLLGLTAEFEKSIPYGTLILIVTVIKCVLHCLSQYGHLHNIQDFTGNIYRQDYQKFLIMLEKVLDNERAGAKLDQQLAKHEIQDEHTIIDDDNDEFAITPMDDY